MLDRTAFVEPLVLHGTDEQWLVIVTNRRAARMFVGPGDALEETDRIVDDVHSKHEKGGWSQSNYQRSVEKEVQDHLANAAELAFNVYKKRGLDRVLVGGPDELLPEFKGKLHPYLRERIVGRIAVDVENASLDDVCARRQAADRGARAQAASARRWTGWRRASAPAGAARPASPRCSTRSTRRAWRRC